MPHYRGEATPPQASDPGVPAFSSGYYVDVDGGADWLLENLKAVYEQKDQNLLKKKFTALQEACLREDVFVLRYMEEVAAIALGNGSAPIAGEV